MDQLPPFPCASLTLSYIFILAFFWTCVRASLLIHRPLALLGFWNLSYHLLDTPVRLSEIRMIPGPSKFYAKVGSACL